MFFLLKNIFSVRHGSYMPPVGTSLWNFYLPYGHITEQVAHSRGLGTILVRYIFGTSCSVCGWRDLDHMVSFESWHAEESWKRRISFGPVVCRFYKKYYLIKSGRSKQEVYKVASEYLQSKVKEARVWTSDNGGCLVHLCNYIDFNKVKSCSTPP